MSDYFGRDKLDEQSQEYSRGDNSQLELFRDIKRAQLRSDILGSNYELPILPVQEESEDVEFRNLS